MKREERTRENVSRAALDALCKRGFKETTMSEIAKKAGVNEVTIYRHFGSKDGLFADVVEKTIRSRFEALRLDYEPSENIILDLTEMGLSLAKYFILNANLTKLIMMELDNIPPALREYTSNAMFTILMSLRNYFSNAMEKGLIRRIDPHLAALVFYSFFYRNMLAHAFRKRDLLFRADRVSIRRFVILFVYGILKEEGA